MIKILSFFTLVLNTIFIKNYLHVYQLKDYKNIRFFKFFINLRLFLPVFCAFLLAVQIIFKFFILQLLASIVILAVSFIYNSSLIANKKTPLVLTPKIKRIYVISCAILIIIFYIPYSVGFSCLSLFFLPPVANFLNIYDKIKNKIFIKNAQQKIKKVGCKIIAITGSNGKTSVKNILYEMLLYSYKVQATPKSYNTPLGIAKFINDQLNADTQFLILEYGARHKNDIKKLCKIFGADFGIITLVAPQHLESFKHVENIFKAKQELSKYLVNKFCVFNLDNLYTNRMHLEHSNNKQGISIFSTSKIRASNIYVKNFKTYFTLCLDNVTYKCSTHLLGEHNITNILLALGLAVKLNVSINDILSAIKKLQPTPHRLEYIKGKINILDDSYNCSLSSAEHALKVLSYCPGEKVVVTPGIIEGGKSQHYINYQLGTMCANIDKCIIIGETNKNAIYNGLKDSNFNLNNIICCNNLESAKKEFLNLNINDTLLLLNDLPDDYK